MTKIWLPDVNFWLALTFEPHKHHRSASSWMADATAESCVFCRMTQQGFLRLATNRRAFGADALTMADAWRCYDQTVTDFRVAYVDEPEDVEVIWRSLTARQEYSPKVWNDAFLAAFAQAAEFELVTFDRGLEQYRGVRCVVLS